MAETGLKGTVQSQMMAAMKAGDKNRTQVLRMVLSEIKAREADNPQAVAVEAVSGYAKKLRKAMGEMEKLGQAAHVAQLKTELAIVEEFLPRQMDDEALSRLVSDVLGGLGPLTQKDIGRAMGAVMKAVAAAGGSADAAKVRARIASKITAEPHDPEGGRKAP